MTHKSNPHGHITDGMIVEVGNIQVSGIIGDILNVAIHDKHHEPDTEKLKFSNPFAHYPESCGVCNLCICTRDRQMHKLNCKVSKPESALSKESGEFADQQAEPFIKKSKDSHVEAVIAKLRKRSEVGQLKYGKTLERDDLSIIDWLIHAQEESMDFTNYLQVLQSKMSPLSIGEHDKFLKSLSKHYGQTPIMTKVTDTIAELTVELMKEIMPGSSAAVKKIVTEIADVTVMLIHLTLMYDEDKINKEAAVKIQRQKDLMNGKT